MNYLLFAIYLLIAAYLFRIWFNKFQEQDSLSDEEKVSCFLTLIVASVFWSIVLPIAYSKLVSSRKYKDLERY